MQMSECYAMFQSKERLIRNSDPSLWALTGLDFGQNDADKLSNRIWNKLNSKLINGLIVILVLIEGFVVITLLLIDSDLITDPKWIGQQNCTNATNFSNVSNYENNSSNLSPTLLKSKEILTYISLSIISIFFIEILFRIYSGKFKLFIQPFELLDALLVNILFILNVIFFLHNSDDGKSTQTFSLLIVLLRLWRVFKIIQILIEESQHKFIQLLSICEKEKTHAEHKNDILILKVEDLEHEVAYLKEKLKKVERENSAFVQNLMENKCKKNAKRTQSSQSSLSHSYCPCRTDSFNSKPIIHNHISNYMNKFKPKSFDYCSVNIETEPEIITNDLIDNIDNSIDLDHFARSLAQSITVDVMSVVIGQNHNNSSDLNAIKYISNKTSPSSHNHINSVIKPSVFDESNIYSSLLFITNESNHSLKSRIASNVNSCAAVHQLNEDLEIERMTKVSLGSNDMDIPLSSL